MPTYVYRREDGSQFEVFQAISDPPLTEDPETGQPVKRVISGGAGLQFKGTGFYITDYVRKSDSDASGSETKSDSTKNEAKSDTSGTSSTSGKSEAKSSKSSGSGADKSE